MAMQHLQEMIQIITREHKEDGIAPTEIPYLSFIRATQKSLMRQGVLEPSFCLLLQGEKKVLLGKEIFNYGPGNFLAAAIDIPISGQISKATKDKPYLGIKISFDVRAIAEMIVDHRIEGSKSGRGAYIGKASDELQDAILRLLRTLGNPKDLQFFAPTLQREIAYRLLTANDSAPLFKKFVSDFKEVGIGKAVAWIKKHFAEPLSIEDLAREAEMSVSGFHHKFKVVTTMAPLQYQKQLRLLEARRLLLAGTADAATAAFEVGYESASQFSREYKRLFGAPPVQDVDRIKSVYVHDFETERAL